MAVPSFLIKMMLPPKLGRNLRLGPEDQISIEFANRLRGWTLDGSLQAVWSHVPNELGGSSDKKTARFSQVRYAIAKALGLIPGTSDYIFLAKDRACCIEMKSGTGRQNPSQKDFQSWCEINNVPYAIARSADEAEGKLREWELLK